MKKISLMALSLIVSTSLVQAKNFKLLVLGESGEQTGTDLVTPPIYLNSDDSIRLQLGYYGNQYDKAELFTNGKYEGKKTTKMDEKSIFASLSYDGTIGNGSYSFGGQYQKFTQAKEQWGYYEEKNGYFPYDSLIDVEGEQWDIIADISYGSADGESPIYARLSGTVTPQTKLTIDQNTKIFPNLKEGGVLGSTSTTELSYLIEGEARVNLGKYIDFGVDASYGFMPYDYQLKVINSNRDGYVEVTDKYDEVRTKLFGKIFIKKWLSDDFFPTVGFGRMTIERKYPGDIETDKVTQNLILFGIEKWFD